MAASFTRQLNAESGVQLNPLRDNSEIPTADNYDQQFATMCRLTRGRIDKPFKVNKGNYQAKIGKGEAMRVSMLNEAWVHIVEALNNGAYEAIVQRLITSAAVIKYAVARLGTTTSDPIVWSVTDTLPTTPFLIAIKHLECFNDGIKCEIHVEEKRVGGMSVANDKINLRIKDKDNLPLFDFTGSLNPDSLDDYQQTNYLSNLVANQTDAVEVYTWDSITEIAANSPAYGYNETGLPNWASSPVLVCFDEGGTGYTTADYIAARTALQTTPFNFGYISSGGTQSPALLAQFIQLAYETNKPMPFDVYGGLSKEAAIAFYEQLNIGGNFNSSHLVWSYWTPLKSQDPTGVNGKGFLGTATLNIAYACARNAVKNARGYAPKNYPVAGKDFPLNRRAVTQVVQLSGQDKNDLARAKINPVISETYTGGQRYVFFDSLTGALVDNSLKKLTAVIDMSVDIDDRITRRSKDLAQKPIDVAVSEMSEFLHQMRADLRAADWVVPPKETSFSKDFFEYRVMPHGTLIDAIVVDYWPCFVGTTRQIYCTQTLVI